MTFSKSECDPPWKVVVTFCKGAEVGKRLLGVGSAGRIVASVDRRRGRPFASQMSVLHDRRPRNGRLASRLWRQRRRDVHLRRDGVVYQKDLGPNTAALGASMTQYNPDKGG